MGDRLDLSEAQLQRGVLRVPAVLAYNFENNLKPKLDFLETKLRFSLHELRERVLKAPALLRYSHTKRYKPRHYACRKAKVDVMLVLDKIYLKDEEFYALVRWKASERLLSEEGIQARPENRYFAQLLRQAQHQDLQRRRGGTRH